MSTSTASRTGAGWAVTVAAGIGVGSDGEDVVEGVADGAGSDDGSTSSGSRSPVSSLACGTTTVTGADRSGTGPARNRSTLATARSNRCRAPNVSFVTAKAPATAVTRARTITPSARRPARRRRGAVIGVDPRSREPHGAGRRWDEATGRFVTFGPA